MGAAWAANAWQQTSGPLGGRITALAVDPVTTATVYASAVGSGVYKTTDGGGTWSAANAGMGNMNVWALLVNPSTPSTLYAGGNSGVLRSQDAGASWSSVLSGASVTAIAAAPGSPAVLYAGTAGNGVQKSTDGGASWATASTGLEGSYVAAITVDPGTPTTLYAGTSVGAYKSVDAGATWAAAGVGLPSTYVHTIAIDAANANILYAGSDNGYAYKSTDGGANWTQAGSLMPGGVYGLYVGPANSPLYARTAGGVYKSTDAGANWLFVNGQPPYVQALAFDPSNPATMYAGTLAAGMFTSGDSGATWSPANMGLRLSQTNAVLVDPGAPSTLYAATESGVFTSLDAGGHWTTLGLASSRVPSLALDPSAPGTIYAGTSNGLLKSTNGGGTWAAADSGMPAYSYITALAIHPTVPAKLYAGTSSKGLYRSTDGGAHWTATSLSIDGAWTSAIVIDPTVPTTVYASVGGKVYKSVDDGASWALSHSGLPSGREVQALAIHPLTPATLYALTSDGQIFKSVDSGGAWANNGTYLPLSGGEKKSLVIDPTTPTTLYAAGKTVWKSTDGGERWAEASSGLTDAAGTGDVLSLAIDPQTPGRLYAGTRNRSVFKSTNGALSSGVVLKNLQLQVGGTPLALLPAFNPYATGPYTATVQGAASATLTPTTQLSDATVSVNGTSVASGTTSAPVTLNPGENAFSVTVTSGDATATQTYTVTVTRQVVAPAAPTSVQAVLGTPGTGQATVSWTPSAASGSSALANYTVVGGSGCTTGPGDSSCIVSGLANGTSYTFTVTAINAEGATNTSASSNTVTPLASCVFNGSSISSGGSVLAYATSSVPFGSTCQQQTRACYNGTLSGSYAHASCTPAAPAACTFNGQPVAHGASVTAFLNAAEPAGGSCTPQSRSCNDGTLSGSYGHAACQVAPSAPTGVRATPVGGGQVTVTWQPPANAGSGVTGYVVIAQPGGQICTPTPATATTCTFTALNPALTYSFTVQARNDAGGATSPAPSNLATPLADVKTFSAPSPTGSGAVGVTVAGGSTCSFESVQLVSAASSGAPSTRKFPHGVLDFVLHGCDTTGSSATITITYPSGTPLHGAQYWKGRGGVWSPFASATLGSNMAVLTLVDGGVGDDDGVLNGRIVDPGGVSVPAVPDGGAPIPALAEWMLALLAALLGLLAWRHQRCA